MTPTAEPIPGRPSNGLARTISIIGHPMLLLSIAIGLATGQGIGPERAALVLGMALAGMAAVAIFVVRGVRAGRIQHIDVPEREKRGPVYAIAASATLLSTLVLALTEMGRAPIIGSAIATALLMVAALINRVHKISLHVGFDVYAAGILGTVWPLGGALMVVIALLVAWSRVRLGRHTAPEVLSGLALGAVGAAALLLLLTR